MKTVLYFTAGMTPTAGELADIAKLNALAEKPFDVKVLSGLRDCTYDGNVIEADYVAGTVPDSYKEEGTEIYDVLDPDAPPAFDSLPSTQAIVTNADELDVNGETVTLAVSDNEVTASIPATKAIVTNGDEITVTGDDDGTVVLTVVDGVVTGGVFTAGN